MITEEMHDYGDIKGVRVGGSIFGSPLMTVIFYHLDDILIDTGPYCARVSIKKYIECNKIDKALLTHYHEDHAGNARFLVDNGIRVFGHEKTVSKLEKKNRLKPYEHILFGKLESVTIDLLPTVVNTEHFNLVPIHTPGHSCDHTVYHEPNRGWLFSGDLFLGAKIKYWRRDEDMRATLESLDQVLKLDFGCLFCGHNPKLKNPKKHIEQKKHYLLELIHKVRCLRDLGHCRNEVINILTKGKEVRFAKLFTLGDASYKNMIVAAMEVAASEP